MPFPPFGLRRVGYYHVGRHHGAAFLSPDERLGQAMAMSFGGLIVGNLGLIITNRSSRMSLLQMIRRPNKALNVIAPVCMHSHGQGKGAFYSRARAHGTSALSSPGYTEKFLACILLW